MGEQSTGAASPVRRPTRRGVANREAMVVAARDLFADAGPSAVSIRSVAERAGCSHALVGRQFGSKAGLEAAVIERLAIGMSVLTTRMCSSEHWPLAVLIESLRLHPQARKVITRCALGEFDPEPLLAGHTLGECLASRIEHRRGGDAAHPGVEARLAAYGALSTVLGLVSFEPLLIAGARADDLPSATIDAAIAGAAEAVAALAVDDRVTLRYGRALPHPPVMPAPDLARMDSRSALVHATIELLSAIGPAPLTTREIAERAQVNQGLIYHHFGSREQLFAEAIAEANRLLQDATPANTPLDITGATRARVRSMSIPLMARLMVNGIDIREVRREYPVFDRLLADVTPRATAIGRDPRLDVMAAVCFSTGAQLWDRILRRMIGIPVDADLVEPMAAITNFVLRRPDRVSAP